MLSRAVSKATEGPLAKLFWAVVSVLVLGQLVAFYMLCSQQVQKGQTRDSNVQTERIAIASCLQQSPQATLSSCAARVAPIERDVIDSQVAIALAASSGSAGPGGSRTIRSAMSAIVPTSFLR